MTSVRLFLGWVWLCPTCGNRNINGGEPEDDPAILAQAREVLDLPDGEAGALVSVPEQVFCGKCESRFTVVVV